MLHVQDHTICKQKCFTSFFQIWMPYVSFSCLIAWARTKAFSIVRVDMRVDISGFCFLSLPICFWLCQLLVAAWASLLVQRVCTVL